MYNKLYVFLLFVLLLLGVTLGNTLGNTLGGNNLQAEDTNEDSNANLTPAQTVKSFCVNHPDNKFCKRLKEKKEDLTKYCEEHPLDENCKGISVHISPYYSPSYCRKHPHKCKKHVVKRRAIKRHRGRR